MNHRYLSFLLALFLALPLAASAQEGEVEQEGEAAPAPEEGVEATEDEAAPEEAVEEEAAPEPEPEPEVSAVESEMGDPSADGADGTDSPASTDSAPAAEGEGGEGEAPPPPEGGGAGLRWDLETGRWVEDVEPLPWRNSLFVWNHNVALGTIAPNACPNAEWCSANPTYIQNFSLRPRWYISGSVSVRLRQDLNWELTPVDAGGSWASLAGNNSAQFGDTQAGLIDTSWFMAPGDIAVGGGVTAFFPTSIGSRNCGLIGGLQGSVSGTKVFPSVLTGLTIQVFGAFRGNAHYRDVCQLQGGSPYPDSPNAATLPDGTALGDYGNTGGVSNAMISGQLGAFVGLAPLPELSFGVTWLNQWNLGRGLGEACFEDPSGSPEGITCIDDLSNTHTRTFTFFSLSATWLINNWVNTSLSYGSFITSLDSSGNAYNPFANPASQFTLQAVFILDRVYQGVEEMLESDDEEEDPATATARAEDEEEDSDGEQVAALRSNRRAAQ